MDFSSMGGAAAGGQMESKGPKPKMEKKAPKKAEKMKDANQNGIEYSKEENFSLWYTQIITKSEMIEYYEISGCYILRPLSFYIWE